ncbi:hypothetical protein GCM10010401_10060 [Rarobacter faecitabidus]|uniref:Ig-like domain-containing protein n=1 Tax=Rarobacter faecitabidus TaxID=13243 RepID=A0A542ZA43_RARFA|nr:hypothetical protein [Rarobacter faecitabidus]TQL57171.1 hypothetical protein FB461_2291 [Rarobacter faecitabidus]
MNSPKVSRRTRQGSLLRKTLVLASAGAVALGLGAVATAPAQAATAPPVTANWLDYYFNNKGIGGDAAGDAPHFEGGKGFHRSNLVTGGLGFGSEQSHPSDSTLKYWMGGENVGPFLDNIESAGQTIDTSAALGSGAVISATKIAFVWSAHNASDIGGPVSFTLKYANNTQQTVQRTAPDWCSDGNADNVQVASRQPRYGDNVNCTIFATTPIALTGTLDSIVLPSSDRVHVFAIASNADTSNAKFTIDSSLTLPASVHYGDTIQPTIDWGAEIPPSISGAWYLNGAVLSESRAQLVVPSSWVGKTVSYAVTIKKPGLRSRAFISNEVLVEPGALSTTVAPTLTGLPRVGDTLVVDAGQYAAPSQDPAVVGIAIQWLADSVPIPGATSAQYIPVAADTGKKISARITASKLGFNDVVTTTAQTTAVIAANVNPFPTEPGQPTEPTPQPALIAIRTPASTGGTVRVGATVKASAGTYEPAGAAISYRWLRGASVIPGAAKATYTIQPADLGKVISVEIHATASGRQPITQVKTLGVTASGVISASKSKVVIGKKTVKSATKPRVGQKMTVRIAKAQTPGAKATTSIQWYANGKKVSGKAGKKATLKVSKKLRGKRLQARVTYKATGYTAKTVKTVVSGKVR